MIKPLLALLLASVAASAAALPPHTPVPGGVAVVDLGPASEPAPTARRGEQSLAIVRERNRWHALVGIPLDAPPGNFDFEVFFRSTVRTHSIAIADKRYPEQRLTIKDQRKVEPNPDDLRRIEREQKITEAVKKRFSEGEPDTALDQPSPGPLSSRFGLKRFFNGLPRNPHAGLDVAAGTGTPVHAPSDAVVANTGDYFFNGNTVFLDHGQGLITAYMHLSRIDVRPGQLVKRGKLLGAIGATGRVTGPHLHWAVILNNTPVDPEIFLTRRSPK